MPLFASAPPLRRIWNFISKSLYFFLLHKNVFDFSPSFGEVPVTVIGELVMHYLKSLDQVAYVRFASVYRAFKDVSDFVEELQPMLPAAKRKNGKHAPKRKGGKPRK